MKKSDLASFCGRAESLSRTRTAFSWRKSRDQNAKRNKRRKLMNKIATLAREAFEIWILVKNRKDPVALTLGAISTYNALSDLFERESPQPSDWLKSINAVKVLPMLCSIIYHTLKQMDVAQIKCWGNEGYVEDDHDAQKIEEFDLGEGVKAWFVATDGHSDETREPHEGPWTLDKTKFIERFSNAVKAKLGNIIAINTITKGWDNYYYLASLDIPTDLYVSTINEIELIEHIEKYQARGFNRAMLFTGPPGTGKTTMAARIAKHLGGGLLVVTSQILEESKGRMALEGLIEIIDPAVVLFDDFDKVWNPNDMLDSMERLNRKGSKRLLIGTINTLGDIPRPLRRPGRFDQVVEFSNPNLEQRRETLAMYMKEYSVPITEEQLDTLAEECSGMSGAYLHEVAKRGSVVTFERLLVEAEQICRINELDDEEDEDDQDGEVIPSDGKVEKLESSAPSSESMDGLVAALTAAFEKLADSKEEKNSWHSKRRQRKNAK